MFTDTMSSSVLSRNGNKYAQVFLTNFGWVKAFPMQRKSEAHEALSLLFSCHGVPHTMIMDGSKEQILGEFKKKLRQADCRLKQIEPRSPWMNDAERAIKELKLGSGRKMMKSKAPKCLWDHCLELEATIRPNTALNIYGLDGEVKRRGLFLTSS